MNYAESIERLHLMERSLKNAGENAEAKEVLSEAGYPQPIIAEGQALYDTAWTLIRAREQAEVAHDEGTGHRRLARGVDREADGARHLVGLGADRDLDLVVVTGTAARHRRPAVGRLATPLPGGVRRLDAPARVVADTHAAGGSGDRHDRGGQSDGYVQGAHGGHLRKG